MSAMASSAADRELESLLTPSLIAGARAWLEEPVKVVTKAEESDVLFVPEGCWACVPRSGAKMGWIGTDDATTCHCIALVSETHAAITHLNSGRYAAANLKDMLEAMGVAASGAAVQVFVGGGMGGAGIPGYVTATSLETTKAFFAALRDWPSLEVKLACVGHLNTTAKDGNPACRGMCVSVATGQVVRAEYDDDARGHEFLMRYGAGHLSAVGRGILNHYDHALDAFLVPKPSVERCKQEHVIAFFEQHAQKPDDVLLSHSTSPGYEKPRFATDQRGSALRSINIARDVAAGKPPIYKTTADGDYLIVPRLPEAAAA